VATTRFRLRSLRHADAKATDPPLDDLLGEGLRVALPGLIKELSHKEVRVRLATLYVLETMEAESAPAAGAVADALKDGDAFVRWGAARVLGKMAPLQADKAVPGLAGVVADANGDVRSTALAALPRYGRAAKAAIPALRRVLNQGDGSARMLAIQALAAMGPEAEPALTELVAALSATETDIRAAAAQALGKIGPAARPAEDALRKALNDPGRQVRQAAGDALLVIR